MDPLADLTALIRSRRTSVQVHPDRAVPRDLVTHLCSLAMWAPNHKRTWPWRFAAFVGDGRNALGEAFAADLRSAEAAGERPVDGAKVAKTRTKYLRAPTVVVVGATADTSPNMAGENRDATAAGIQNLLLGATAAGLASFWSTAPVRRGSRSQELCGFTPDVDVVGVVYLGWPSGTASPPERPPVRINWTGA